VGITSFVIVRTQTGGGDTLLVRQRKAQALSAAAVERVVKVAPDPVTRAPGLRATCMPTGQGELRNPWRCVIHYRSGRIIGYRVRIRGDGSYVGDHEILSYRGQTSPDTGAITGCCITIP
jgi:hypothetical protein